MKQILQNLGNGETILAEVPCPATRGGELLIETNHSLVSLGTEKMLIDFGKGGLLAKARSQPDKVKQVLQKVKTDGLLTTIDAVKSKLDTPIPLGYCNVGSIIESPKNSGYQIGDRVASNGPHAEVAALPTNLTAKIPELVSDEQAAFTVVGAIGLQGLRLLSPTLGERIVVSGLGLIGLLTVQMLRAQGCSVLGIDFDQRKLELARQFGAETVDLSAGEDPVQVANNWTKGIGVDGVLITAATKSNELIHQAATMCRKRGRIVLVGVIGLNLQRADFYEKELTFQVSCSYGPGRYENAYEDQGMDYPIGYVRWTEQRNFEAVLQLMADQKIDVEPLITHRFPFDDALTAYQAISEPAAMGILLDYGPPQGTDSSKLSRQITTNQLSENSKAFTGKTAGKTLPNIAVIGTGNFTTRTLLPAFPQSGIQKSALISRSGVSATHAAKKFGFKSVSTDFDEVLKDSSINTVFITTRHNLHAGMVCNALKAGKHVFVEKPLAMNMDEMTVIRDSLSLNPELKLMVGFNRRFSPHIKTMKDWLRSAQGDKSVLITVNAGHIPEDHWTQDNAVGGGRIVGEACHFIDLARHLIDSPIESCEGLPMRGGGGRLGDCASIQMAFEDGSIANVLYLANGAKDFPKERIEVFAGGKVFSCDNFRSTREYGGKRKFKTRQQDKGHATGVAEFIASIQNATPTPIALEEIMEVSAFSINVADQIRASLA